MNKRKYRLFIICCLVLDLLVMLISGYRYLDRKIPDEIQISRGKKTEDVTEVLSTPFVTFEEAVTVSQDGGYILPCKLLGYIPFKEIKVTPADDQEIYVSGSTIGIYMQTEGVLVIDTGEIQNRNGETEEPARNIIRQGDYIISFNGEKISTKRELIDDISELDGSEVTLGISRKGESIPVSVTPVKDKKGDYKLGIWVRDDTQGIGTLTYVDQNGNYGALGHGISDIDTAQLLNIRNGALYKARILAINKGSKGNPGELAGYICYDDRNILGTIEANSRNGIYGQFTGIADDAITLKKMPAAYKQEVKIGTATILPAVWHAIGARCRCSCRRNTMPNRATPILLTMASIAPHASTSAVVFGIPSTISAVIIPIPSMAASWTFSASRNIHIICLWHNVRQ